ncbi:DUF1707 domain-containing protein [Streptomyces albireticuli]|uniref:DUF1707 domain-containing protein n=1 Tax=Streptomyces albireticuli TaxID=1940 RepID=A0A2A2CWN5_9ACTN|nr:DUF1707 domain-containing protein [Streptomyces albireticuli]MCD9141546.1 DUF1707 domain-containing protein [Streptomyces albireticuli]MCD9164203.1 DUF1707 domain-containing protein [Streptomyces albireticuli]MCD9189720.1 DUF1707 domain-containing protein [Streptomyces albireticuli]PAU44618.1 hypothetical protein CK936_34025 [Streptomyces albireticuli]
MMSELPDMRASDAERERITEALREAVAEGRLDMEEFEQRLDAAYKARTRGELEPLVRDLPAPGSVAPAPAVTTGPWRDRIGGTGTSKVAVGVWGGFHRKGGWTVPRKFTAFTMWGGGEIDLREARFEDGEIVIRCFALMGGMSVVVPKDLDVQVSGVGIMGGFGDEATGPGTPGSPRVRITGLAIWGGVSVERKLTKAEKEERERLQRTDREERRLSREDRREQRRLGREERRKSLE